MSLGRIGEGYSVNNSPGLNLPPENLKTILKVVSVTAEAVGIGFCGWASGGVFGDPLRSDNKPRSVEEITTLTIATVFLVASIANFFFRAHNIGKNRYPAANYVATPPVILGAYLIGVAILSNQNNRKADVIWNVTSHQNLQIAQENHAAEMNFDYQVENCNVAFSALGEAFTWPRCYLCPTDGTTSTGLTTWVGESRQFNLLQYAMVPLNQTLCKPTDPRLSPFWPYFGSLSVNTTEGKWPCNPNTTVITTNITAGATAMLLKAMIFIEPPFAITATPLLNRTSCFHIEGFGSRTFDIGMVCKYSDTILSEIPKEFKTCLTEHFYEHAKNYSATYAPYVPLPKVLYPGRVSKFHNDGYTTANVIYFAFSAAISFSVGVALELRHHKLLMQNERKALLTSA